MNWVLIGAVGHLAASWVLLCRVATMSPGVTQPRIVLQHAMPALLAFGAGLLMIAGQVVPEAGAAAPAASAAGMLVFLLASTRRWRDGAPDDTSRPMPLDDDDPHTALEA